ncbi:MAG: DMT family transporter [Patescibacteria group bacterium]
MKKFILNNKAVLLIVTLAIAGGAVPVFVKIATQEIPPAPFTLLRFAFALVILAPIFWAQKEKINFNKLKGAIIPSVFGAGNVILFAIGIRMASASSAQMLYTTVPLLAGIFSYFLLQERLSKKKIAGIIIGFSGALVIIMLPVITGQTSLDGNLTGNLIIMSAVLSQALYSVFSKKSQKKCSPIFLTLSFAIATIVLQFPLVFAGLHDNIDALRHFSMIGFLCTAYVGIVGTGLWYLLYQFVIKNASATIASMTLYLQPVFTIVWAILLLNEKIGLGFFIGSCLAFAGIFLAANNRKETYGK